MMKPMTCCLFPTRLRIGARNSSSGKSEKKKLYAADATIVGRRSSPISRAVFLRSAPTRKPLIIMLTHDEQGIFQPYLGEDAVRREAAATPVTGVGVCQANSSDAVLCFARAPARCVPARAESAEPRAPHAA